MEKKWDQWLKIHDRTPLKPKLHPPTLTAKPYITLHLWLLFRPFEGKEKKNKVISFPNVTIVILFAELPPCELQ
ncbi:putative inactive leucine-rich repeat receptor-like protein kinase [Gossypium australe]|uniref:Putative inactive leucine-rich repeat receptor-like protein kinase n=1 Tax=Gossypium australe TaxID=47621 RepID=A0A5B6WYJ3_9ROSI|nr:putative inactive leucine-rich repeat receptor-like protein kinase [Gossypium australe]